ncbi:proline-rich nuclear receptor coactivator 1 isoform X1 [Larus michahellis]|uniref:proline-rich nuclear receptor coactivator 1 isoform X1 n=1 Tax=Larus michahellis TaxID=119627 RepID=UPI003D9B9F8A
MVTTTAPPPFLARISAGTEDPRRLPSALLQRLRRGDSNCENQPSCCLAGPGGSARPALKRVRRRKGKIRPSPAGLLPSRYQQYQQHRAGLGRRTPLGTHGPAELRPHSAPTVSAAAGLVAAPPEEPPAPAPSRPTPSKPLRKEACTGSWKTERGPVFPKREDLPTAGQKVEFMSDPVSLYHQPVLPKTSSLPITFPDYLFSLLFTAALWRAIAGYTRMNRTIVGSWILIFPHFLTFPSVTWTVTLSLVTLLTCNILEVTWSGTEAGCESVIYTPMGKTDTVLLQYFFRKTTAFFIAEITS